MKLKNLHFLLLLGVLLITSCSKDEPSSVVGEVFTKGTYDHASASPIEVQLVETDNNGANESVIRSQFTDSYGRYYFEWNPEDGKKYGLKVPQTSMPPMHYYTSKLTPVYDGENQRVNVELYPYSWLVLDVTVRPWSLRQSEYFFLKIGTVTIRIGEAGTYVNDFQTYGGVNVTSEKYTWFGEYTYDVLPQEVFYQPPFDTLYHKVVF